MDGACQVPATQPSPTQPDPQTPFLTNLQGGMMEGLVTCLLRLLLRREAPLEVVNSGAGRCGWVGGGGGGGEGVLCCCPGTAALRGAGG